MKKVLLSLLITACLVGTARAGTITYNFNDLPVLEGNASPVAYGQYLQDVSADLSNIAPGVDVVIGGKFKIVTQDPLGSDQWLQTESSVDRIEFTFSAPISSVTFDWATQKNDFVVDYGGQSVTVYNSTNNQVTSGDNYTLDFDSPVYTLAFHDSASGWIGVDDLVINVVPLPASILLGVLAVGLAGRKLRELV